MPQFRPIAVFLAAALWLTLTVRVRAELSFADIPAARDVESSRAGLALRIKRVLAYWSSRQRIAFPTRHGRRTFTQVALAKLHAGQEVAEINRALLAKSARPYARYGTRITVIPGLCARKGDYDFMAEELVRLASSYIDSPLSLWPATARKIAWELLPEAGAKHYATFRLGICGRHRDSENHILMTETSRYLTNQLRRRLGEASASYDNRKNGFDAWMMRHVSRFLRGHFEEYNSRPYQGYTVEALSNLHTHAESFGVTRSAELVLDYLSAIYAVQSNGLRRNAPFRRKAKFAATPYTFDRDPETARYALLAGNYEYLHDFGGKVPYGADFMLSAAVGRYRVPDLILDLMVRKDRGPYYQRFHHDTVELYASSPSFLLSAGGVFAHHFRFGSREQHGWARATTIIPTRDKGADTRAFLRIAGSRSPELRNNSCVAPNFACGANVIIPDSIPASCRERRGQFEFLNFDDPRCPLKLGFYAAARIVPCTAERCGLGVDNVGVFEVREANGRFADFRARILRNNRRLPISSDGLSTYVTSDGRRYVFEVLADNSVWPIVSIDGRPQLRSFRRWPLAEGDLMQAKGDGKVVIENPFLGERLVLDARDPLRPARTLERFELPVPDGAAVAQRE